MKKLEPAKKDGLTPHERVIAEQSALQKKIEALDKALTNDELMSTFSAPERALLQAQYLCMLQYNDCLIARLSIWRD